MATNKDEAMRPRAVIDENAVQIKFLNKDGSLSEAPKELDVIPVIEIEVEQHTSGGIRASKALALMDTGADHRAIDKYFAENLGFESSGITTSSGIGGFAKDINYYNLNYRVKTNGDTKYLNGNFAAPSLTDTGRKYQVLLGMSFMQKGRLIMDSKTHEYLFEFND
ncbi:hypothetical protein K8374_10030 [Pseudomonas sp. p1(2021b)]|uniref:hypothetical protein n=1 Tax=Pseudomonas sp. p1(2021b) TaxID=2874628 RepID=UPI001CC915C9|nr:hypothetical protein [Pseudomonas sp. p1(2021b)]UBM27260.1 hypothetical protein K8374_10030 [Pseudomonas sp. p1(2021b)]